MLSHLNLWSSALAYGHDVKDLANERTKSLVVLPLFHIGGSEIMFSTVIRGGCCVFLPSFSPESFLKAVQNAQITHTLIVPTMVRMILDDLGGRDYDLSSLKVLIYGSAPMSQAQIEEAMVKLPDVQLQQGYGQTELSPYVSTLGPDFHVFDGEASGRLRSVGRAGFCSETYISDANGRELPRGEIGELHVRGPHVMLGYWRRPEETASTVVDGWVRTGDAGYMDKDGFIFLIDRMKDMIVTGGENIYSTEVENALATHPAVATAVVFGDPHERWGESVHAVVRLRDGYYTTVEDLINHARSIIAGYKCPRSLEFRTERFPLSGAGKVLKRELRDAYWKGRSSALV